MKKLFSSMLLVILAASAYSQTWTQKANFPGGTRYGSTSLTLNDKIYVGLGTNFSTYYSDWWEYNSANDTWTQKASFPGGIRYISTGIAINGKGYVGLGITGGGTPFPTDWWEYDPATDTWTAKASFPDAGRYGTSNFELNGKGYVCLGNLNTATGPYSKELWEYNPATDSWKKKAKFPAHPRYGGAGFSIGDKGYVGLGGILAGSGYTFYKDFFEYDPATDAWTKRADFPNRRTFPAAFVLDGKGYVGFGQKQGLKYYHDFYAYDPASDAWLSKIPFPADGRFIPAGVAVNGKGYSGTGYNTITGLFYSDWWEFSPAERLSSGNSAGKLPQLSVYPNPANHEISLSLSSAGETVSAIRIADITGKILKEIKEVGADQVISIDISDLNNGVYFINALTSAGWRIAKFEVQK